jgi:lipid-A-disaccharide synthase-like uncharacterized protein
LYWDLVGTIGACIIALSWVPQTIKTIKNRATGLDLKFVSLYFVGSLSLTLYSASIGNWIFIFFNAFATINALLNIIFTLYESSESDKINNYLKKEKQNLKKKDKKEPKIIIKQYKIEK